MSVSEIADDIRDLVERGWEYPEAEWKVTQDMNLPRRKIEKIREEYLR